MRAIVLSFAAVLFACHNASGWGCEGHQIVALIARAHLTAAASAGVDALLEQNPIDPALKRFCKDRPGDPMADASTWADDAKDIEKTGTWHYVDIPLTATGPSSMAPWCAQGCVTKAIENEWAILRDRSGPASERAAALRYIIHFVGDIHQPLHDSDNNDRGGNCTAIGFFTEDRPANLHAIWDYKLLERDMAEKKSSPAAYAAALDRQFADHWQNWGQNRGPKRGTQQFDPKMDPEAWAWEGNELAKSVTYGDLTPAIPLEKPDPRADCDAERGKVAAEHIAIGDAYFKQTIPVIDEQLAKAGYRLAAVLNASFQ